MERIYSIYGKIIFVPAHIGLDEEEVNKEVDGTNAIKAYRETLILLLCCHLSDIGLAQGEVEDLVELLMKHSESDFKMETVFGIPVINILWTIVAGDDAYQQRWQSTAQ